LTALENPSPPPSAAAAKPGVEVYELILEPPKGFRPHDWPERLMNWDEAADLGEDLIYTRIYRGADTLAVRVELIDPHRPKAADCLAVWSSIMRFVKDNGFTLRIDPRLQRADPRLHETAKQYFETNGIKTVTPDV
jgi:hypothetical protein